MNVNQIFFSVLSNTIQGTIVGMGVGGIIPCALDQLNKSYIGAPFVPSNSDLYFMMWTGGILGSAAGGVAGTVYGIAKQMLMKN